GDERDNRHVRGDHRFLSQMRVSRSPAMSDQRRGGGTADSPGGDAGGDCLSGATDRANPDMARLRGGVLAFIWTAGANGPGALPPARASERAFVTGGISRNAVLPGVPR